MSDFDKSYPSILPSMELNAANFADKYQQQIKALIDQLRALCGKTLDLEGGHIYSDDAITDHYIAELRATALLQEIILNSGHGFDVETTLFVDNYHPEVHSLDVPAYLRIAKEQGLHFDKVLFEADMAQTASGYVQTLQDAGLTKMQNGNLCLITGEHLVKDDDTLSCGVLDATLSQHKLSSVDGAVIVLPHEYKSQQKNMKAIFKALQGLQNGNQGGQVWSFFTK